MVGARGAVLALPRSGATSSMRLLRIQLAQASLQQGQRLLQTSAPVTAAPTATPSSSSAPLEPAASSSSSSSSKAEAEATPARWTPSSKRVGLIALKQGMTTFFLPSGERIPATVLHVAANQVSAHIGFEGSKAPYTAIQVAAVDTFSSRGITQQVRGHLRKAGIKSNKKVIREFKVSKDALIPLGTHLSAAHFVPGQKIDVRALTRGKGFQGAMKRHGFKGLRASHGVSVSHRSHGSTGQNQDPGRVFPGKKMAGRMGGNRHSTTHNLQVLRVDTKNDLIVVKGPVPGPEGGHVELCDAFKDLVLRASNAWKTGKLPDGKGMATGKEGSDEYLPDGIVDLPFPAGTRELASNMPEIVEIGPKEAQS